MREPFARLPSGRHGLGSEYVAAHQRARLLSAIGEACAVSSYGEVSVAEIVRRASVSPRTFYRHFASKEECFLEALRASVQELERAVGAALAVEPEPWPRSAAVAMGAALSELALHPLLAHTLFVDALCAGERSLRVRGEALAHACAVLQAPAGAPSRVREAALGGVVETVYQTVLEGHAPELAGMGEELTYCLLVSLIGHEAALGAASAASG